LAPSYVFDKRLLENKRSSLSVETKNPFTFKLLYYCTVKNREKVLLLCMLILYYNRDMDFSTAHPRLSQTENKDLKVDE
jgi:hypothetical protein